MTSAFYYFLISSLFCFFIALPFWTTLPVSIYLLLIGEGIIFFIAQLALTYALEFSNAQVVSSLYYSNIIFATFITIFFFHTPINWIVLRGIIIAIIGGLLTIRAEAKSKILCNPVE